MQGRSPTCYSPVRHSCTPKGLTVRLACVKHAASVRPEPESNSPNKNNPPLSPENGAKRERNSNQKNLTKQPEKIWPNKKRHTLTRGSQSTTKNKQQTKTTKHTIEFSNNTTRLQPASRATLPAYFRSGSRSTSGGRALAGFGPIVVASPQCTRSISAPKPCSISTNNG